MTKSPGSTRRREVLADAAIEVLASDGVRGLTHRAVDARADLPSGSTSNLFRTRHDLVMGVVARLADLDLADVTTAAGGMADAGAAPGQAIGALLDQWATEHPNRLRARLALTVESLRDPDVRSALDAGRARIVALVDRLRADARDHGRPDPLGAADTTETVAFYAAAQWAHATQGVDITRYRPPGPPH